MLVFHQITALVKEALDVKHTGRRILVPSKVVGRLVYSLCVYATVLCLQLYITPPVNFRKLMKMHSDFLFSF